jgi:hypothetical protein
LKSNFEFILTQGLDTGTCRKKAGTKKAGIVKSGTKNALSRDVRDEKSTANHARECREEKVHRQTSARACQGQKSTAIFTRECRDEKIHRQTSARAWQGQDIHGQTAARDMQIRDRKSKAQTMLGINWKRQKNPGNHSTNARIVICRFWIIICYW